MIELTILIEFSEGTTSRDIAEAEHIIEELLFPVDLYSYEVLEDDFEEEHFVTCSLCDNSVWFNVDSTDTPICELCMLHGPPVYHTFVCELCGNVYNLTQTHQILDSNSTNFGRCAECLDRLF